MEALSARARPPVRLSSAPTAVEAALEDVRRLAEDLIPGANAWLAAPASGEPIAEAARLADGPVDLAIDTGHLLAVPLKTSDGALAAILVADAPGAPSDLNAAFAALARLARMATHLAPLSGEEDPCRVALASVVRSLPVRAFMTDRDMRLVAMSGVSASEMDQPESEVVGHRVEVIRPDIFAAFHAVHAHVLTGQSIGSPRFRFRHPNGQISWFRTENTPWRDSHGDIGGVIMLAIDITDMVEALLAAERSEERLQLAVKIADVHVWELDFVTKELTTAGAFETFFDGSVAVEDIARDTSVTIHPEDRERIAAPWREAVMADIPMRPEYRINRQDGVEVWAAGAVQLVRDDAGVPMRMIGAMHNITDRKAVEDALVSAKEGAEAANRAKSVFLATMSHEIRTPLNGVLGMAQAMAADELTTVQRHRLETIRHSGEALLAILNDLLDLSKIEAGKLELEVVDFELGPLVEGVRDSFAGMSSRKGLELNLDISDEARGLYRGDSARLRQILANLLSNAVKFTEAGEVALSVSRESHTLTFAVSDTGIGIPAERISRLFNKFEQADVSTTRRFGGTGLGLAISRDLATLMGGEIEALSEAGAGSEFRFMITLARIGDESAPAARDEDAEAGFEGTTALRILAAEDNSVNQLVLRTLLQQVGLDPVIVGDGAEALAAWRAHPWDVILMDVQMPVMDGPTATRAIRAEETAMGRRRTPILALTANAMAHQVAEYTEAGMDGLIAKPIRIQELFAALQAALGEEEAEAA